MCLLVVQRGERVRRLVRVSGLRRRRDGVVRSGLALLTLGLLAVVAGCSASPTASEGAAPADRAAASAVIEWMDDYEQAVSEAQQAGKPLMVDVSTTWCSACKRLDEEVFSRADVAESSRAFVPVRVDAEKRPDLEKRFEVSGYPTVIFVRPDGEEVGRVRGAVPYQVMLSEMDKAARSASAEEPG